MSYCPTCKEYMVFPERHACAPEWEAQDPDARADDDWTIIRAYDEEGAATKYAERSDDRCGEGAHERIVLVREPGSSEVKRFAITFDYSVDYRAHEEPA